MNQLFEWFFGLFRKPEPQHRLFLSFEGMIEFLRHNPNFAYSNGIYFFGCVREVIATPKEALRIYISHTEGLDAKGERVYKDFLLRGLPDAEKEVRLKWRPIYGNWRPLQELGSLLSRHGYPPISQDVNSYVLEKINRFDDAILVEWVKKKKLPLVVHCDD